MSKPNKTIEIDGFKLCVDGLDSLGLAAYGEFEPETLAAIKRLTKPGYHVLDIGANIGFFSVHFSRLVGPRGKVYAIEPEKKNFQILQENIRLNHLDNIEPRELAVGASEGHASLFISDWNGGMHRLYASACCSEISETVALSTVDLLIQDERIDLIKIDIEGYEFYALKGAKNCLMRNPDIKIISEYCPLSAIEAGVSPLELLLFLDELGFKPYSLDCQLQNFDDLKREAIKYESYGRERLVSKCFNKNNLEILAIVNSIGEKLGCHRQILENLIFSR